MAASAFIHHASSLEHDTGQHPERAARITAIERALAERDWFGFQRVQAPAAERALIEAVHPPGHVDMIEELCARGGGMIDMDTVASAGSWQAALHAAGGAAHLADLLLGGSGTPSGFCSMRPPGHHAEPNRAMGFCLFNNVAVAARRALDAHGAERVLVLDWDVHHGNGTNAIFHATPEVLFVSIHQSPLYPGTGPAHDVGSGAGRGYTVNLPVPPHSGDGVFVSHVEHLVGALAREFRPGLILVSAGYDAHEDDPLADCSVTDAGYAAMTASLRRLGAEVGAPVGAVLEGGYDLGALARGVCATLESLGAPEPPGAGAGLPLHPLTREAGLRLCPYWPSAAEAISSCA